MKISLIISTKGDPTLKFTLKSTMNIARTYPTELVLVDGSSEDYVNHILEKDFKGFHELYDRTVVLRDPGTSLAYSRYLGYINSSGDLLIFLDGDMILHPRFHSYLVEESRHADVIAPSIRIMRLDPATAACDSLFNTANSRFQTFKSFPDILPQARIFRRSSLDRIMKLYSISTKYFAEDRILTALALMAGHSYKYSSKLQIIKIDRTGFDSYLKKHIRYGYGICNDISTIGKSFVRNYTILRMFAYLNIIVHIVTLYYLGELIRKILTSYFDHKDAALKDLVEMIKLKYIIDIGMLTGHLSCLISKARKRSRRKSN